MLEHRKYRHIQIKSSCARFCFCRDSAVCPDRHSFISQVDQSELPASGLIEVSFTFQPKHLLQSVMV